MSDVPVAGFLDVDAATTTAKMGAELLTQELSSANSTKYTNFSSNNSWQVFFSIIDGFVCVE